MAATTAASTFVQGLSAKKAIRGQELKAQVRVAPVQKSMTIRASDDKVEIASRRAALSMFAAGAMTLAAKPSYAAYGQASSTTSSPASNTSGFLSYAGDGFALLVPAKYGPSKEREFPGAQARWEDNYRVANSIIVTVNPTSKSKIEDFGTPEEFIGQITNMLGVNAWGGSTRSEGGFEKNTVSSAALLSTASSVKKGKTYYEIEMLVRTADGDEGGRHQLFGATVSGGKLYVVKVQNGDKSWFKGGEKPSRAVVKSFQAV